MFEEDMSPKLLNVERLERKFASLTRSRESIQGLSMWIIRHKEFYKEIVNQWLDALKRDFNALTMFYVANDVIQNCARKKAPEYRDAFAEVLEKAMSLEKIKEIKSEVTRMISLWQDREIYEDVFFKKLEKKLNTTLETDESDIEVELTEEEVIANFKLDNLITSLRKLETLKEELSEKQSFLEDIDEPVISNIDNLIVRMESQREIRKIDRFQKLVQDLVSLAEKVTAAEKMVLLDLKYSGIFYNTQNEDVKKVAHAYRIYGKKVKNVEKAMLQKMLSFPVPSPVSSPAEIFSSPILKADTPEKSSPGGSLSPSMNRNSNEGCVPFVIKADKDEIISDVNLNVEKEETAEEISEEHFKIEKEENVFKASFKTEKEENISNVCLKDIKQVASEVSIGNLSNGNIKDEICKKFENELTVNIVNEKCKVALDIKPILSVMPEILNSGLEKSSTLDETDVINIKSQEESLPKAVVTENTATTSKETYSTVMKNISEADIHEDIDFLLEKAYNVQVKSKTNFKRKIDNLLKLKQSKACKVANSEDSVKSSDDNKNSTAPESGLIASVPVDENISNDGKSDKVSKSPILMEVEQAEEKLEITGDETKLHKTEETNVVMIESLNTKQNIETPTIISDDSNNKTIPTSNLFGFQTIPDIPTELLKNILDKNKDNMNLSSNIDVCRAGNIEVSATSEKLDEVESNSNNMDDNIQPSDSLTKSSQAFVSVGEEEPSEVSDEICSADDREIGNSITCESAVSKSDNSIVKNCITTPPTFSESLYNVLKCFTTKEVANQKSNSPKYFKHSPSMPLENTLKVYNCLMHCYSSDYSLTESPLNASAIHLEKTEVTPIVSKMDINLEETKSAVHDTTSLENDNLEIMDMDVDSEDESAD